MKKLYPAKLQKGDMVRVIAPSRTVAIITPNSRAIANKRFEDMGLHLTFGKHIEEKDDFFSSSIASRIDDLHSAFADPQVKAIFTVIGGFNSNQLFRSIDWELLQKNPKILCGFSDITALNNAVFAKTGLVTYSGPHYSTFGQKLHMDYTIDYFIKCFFSTEPIQVEPSTQWSDDDWWMNQDRRKLIKNNGYECIHEGAAEGTILGANLCTFNLLQGTEYMPSLKNSILFIEDDYESVPHTFDRDLQSLIHVPGFSGVRGIVIGRFQKASNMTNNLLQQIINSKKELRDIPVIAQADFGHTDPKFTFPVGGYAKILAGEHLRIEITEH
ncbi:MAG: LD-carboxypeptidase [Candidatus Roizmanbacteria bacterium]|nr:LD-carboxypeptidase [Candidatus Roizmanbacteria bacterium]